MRISYIIKELRKGRNLTQEQLAKNIGYSKAIIGFWENGLNEPTASAIVAIANFFDISTDYLLGLSDDELTTKTKELTKLNNEISGLLNDIKDLNEKDIVYIRGMVDYYKLKLSETK